MNKLTPFWDQYRRSEIGKDAPEKPYESFAFGISSKQANELCALVLEKAKRATSSLLLEYQNAGENLPTVGDRAIILNGQKQPRCIIETSDVLIQRFDEVTEDFAALEGEGDKSLAYWRAEHLKFFNAYLADYDMEMQSDMQVVCETFFVVYQVDD